MKFSKQFAAGYLAALVDGEGDLVFLKGDARKATDACRQAGEVP